MDTIQKRFGARIRQLRLDRGWTQEQLAVRANRHWTYIGGIERGERNVTLEVMADLARALEVTESDLLVTGEDREVERQLSHPLEQQFSASIWDILEAVKNGFRAQVDVKGKLAELFLYRTLLEYEQRGIVSDVQWNDKDGEPDFELLYQTRPIHIECKNVRSKEQYRTGTYKDWFKVEVQKTRRGIDPATGANTRGYSGGEFDVLAACLFNQTGQWEFLYSATRDLRRRTDEPRLLEVMQPVPAEPMGDWTGDLTTVLQKIIQRP